MTRPHWQLFVLISSVVLMLSCAGAPKMLTFADSDRQFPAGAIVDTRSGQAIDFEALVNALASVQVVYVGEQHTRPAHHRIQLQILEAMAGLDLPLAVGMEMFDRTYDPVLARWSEGELTEEAFLQQTHWYANWRYDFGLYRDLLLAVKDRRLPLYGLNLPFHLPAKIAAGGIDSLLFPDRQFVPEALDFSDSHHRAYIEEVFGHHRMPERTRFEFFYQAQVAWEETMAEAVAEHLGDRRMLVIAGNGHIVKKFGIPDRAFRRTQAPFLTVYLAGTGDTVDLDDGDYIWVAPSG
ncbi:MAG: ChaN family lipoprotein [Desulfobacterales bacterium]|nr:ChaN family lipoprotein [Desulfobacterales bacterium]